MKRNLVHALLAVVIATAAGAGCAPKIKTAADPLVPWTQGARETGKYRNLLREAGYTDAQIKARIDSIWWVIYEGPDKAYAEVGPDMAYMSDVKNNDVRTEGMSYAMMVAVQFDRKEMFDRLWRWAQKYMQHKEGPQKGYFLWTASTDGSAGRVLPDGSVRLPGPASDGELYFVTALLFASNRWGNDTGIDYKAEAKYILDCMFEKNGENGIHNIFNVEHKLITFTPDGNGWQYTDVSYHVPAFLEVWAEFADDGRADFWREAAAASRAYLHKATHPVTGINPDLTNWDGTPYGNRLFFYDSWRVPMNIAMDYSWYNKDAVWQQGYANRFQKTLADRYGVANYPDQLALNGSEPEWYFGAGGFHTLRHSIGFTGTMATTAMMATDGLGWEFVHEFMKQSLERYEDGYIDTYYDGLISLFALMHLSGQYRIILPE
ncbi:MAG: glycoside hydrolase [Alistipes sp.]|nr:glycoside hydrolase [Alistipes sp.]